MAIFVIYEWCYAVLAIMLHGKIKRAGSLLLASGLSATAILVTLSFFGIRCNPTCSALINVFPKLMMIIPLFTLTGLAMIVFKWDEYVGKK